MTLLLSEETCREGLFVSRIHKDASEGMFRFGASMNADAGASGDLFQDWEQSMELRTPRHCYLIDQCRNEIVSVFESIADGVQYLGILLCPVVEVMRCPKQSATNGFAICRHAYQFVVHIFSI